MTSRRVTRRTAGVSGLGPLLQSIRGSQGKSLAPVTPLRAPQSVPQQSYTQVVRTPIAGGYGALVVPSSGTVTVMVGPQGVGTVWYPQSAAIATTTGANDNSTCALYLGPKGLQTQIGGQSYAGGGDSIGLAVPPMWPGYFIWAVWTGAKAGDLASLAVYGQQDSLSA